MLEALLAGHSNPETLANLARGRLRAKRAQLEQALSGRVQPHHRFLLAEHLSHIDYLDEAIEWVNTEIANRLHSQETHLELQDTIPGVSRQTAEVILAEIGTDLSGFGDAKHLASWAGMCPGNNESAGKRRSGKTRRGNKVLRVALTQAAQAATRKKGSYLSAQYRRLAARRGKKKAIMAVAHSILVMAYRMLLRHEPYREAGANYFDQLRPEAVAKRLQKRLEALGYRVTLETQPAGAAA